MHGEISCLSFSIYLKNRLIKKGYFSFLDILSADSQTLTRSLKISDAQASELIQECQQNLNLQCSPKFLNTFKTVPTPDETVNILLHGGLKSQCVHEFVGPPNSGRTYHAMMSAISWAKAEELDYIYYIDTEGSVDLPRFKSLDEDKALYDRVLFARLFSETQLIKTLNAFKQRPDKQCGMIVIDSIAFLLKDLQQNDAAKSRMIAGLAMTLQEIAISLNVCIIVINNYSMQQQPMFGESWGCFISKRLTLPIENDGHSI
jgi:RecA/RadA recombinase